MRPVHGSHEVRVSCNETRPHANGKPRPSCGGPLSKRNSHQDMEGARKSNLRRRRCCDLHLSVPAVLGRGMRLCGDDSNERRVSAQGGITFAPGRERQSRTPTCRFAARKHETPGFIRAFRYNGLTLRSGERFALEDSGRRRARKPSTRTTLNSQGRAGMHQSGRNPPSERWWIVPATGLWGAPLINDHMSCIRSYTAISRKASGQMASSDHFL
jgi:hypothetical protein